VVNQKASLVYQTDAFWILDEQQKRTCAQPRRTVQSTSMFKFFSVSCAVALMAGTISSSFAFDGDRQTPDRRAIYTVQQTSSPQQMTSPPVPIRNTYSDRPARGGGGFFEFLFGGGVASPASGYEPVPRYEKQIVDYDGREAAGTIVIDTPSKFLYLVQGNGKALRYGIGVGKPGFTWSGVKQISAKKEWPEWTPPPEMLKRRPDLPRHMEGGPENPLGARAMYLGSTLYRIHGSNEPWTIGTSVSSGCIRMRNEDVIDLYGRVSVGTRVIVI
jgi:lipoprotein-anchoring transpeptidase ErfK/SrfK